MDASIALYTFKDGLLSKFAHDLRLTVTRFEIRARGNELSGRFEPASIRIDGVMKDGKLDRDALSDGDKRKIRDTMLNEVLRTQEHAELRFSGRVHTLEAPFTLQGELSLCGVTRPFAVQLAVRDQRLRGELELTPSQWGIKPYRALGGALKVQDRVRVQIDAAPLEDALNPAIELSWTPAASQRSVMRPSLGR